MADAILSTASFDSVAFDDLANATDQQLDDAVFGVIGFDAALTVTRYNSAESAAAGLSPRRVIGRHLFEEVAPCMNNFMVAQRFLDESELDDIIPYVLTLRMRPTPVRLRLLKSSRSESRFLLVERKADK